MVVIFRAHGLTTWRCNDDSIWDCCRADIMPAEIRTGTGQTIGWDKTLLAACRMISYCMSSAHVPTRFREVPPAMCQASADTWSCVDELNFASSCYLPPGARSCPRNTMWSSSIIQHVPAFLPFFLPSAGCTSTTLLHIVSFLHLPGLRRAAVG